MTGVLPCTHATGVDTGLISLTLRTKPLQHIVIQADGDLLLTGGWLEPTTHHSPGKHLRCSLGHVRLEFHGPSVLRILAIAS